MDIKSWAVGYIDGEGSLAMSSRKSGSGRTYHFPRLIIQVRADDEGAIQKVIQAIGIQPFLTHRIASTRTWNTKPTIQVVWHSKEQLAQVINFFSHYPLQSKKAEEYELWKQTVDLYLYDNNYQQREEKIAELYKRLRELRVYKE